MFPFVVPERVPGAEPPTMRFALKSETRFQTFIFSSQPCVALGEEQLDPALLGFGARQTPKALTSVEAEGEMQSLALNFNSIAYDSFIRAFRLFLRGPAGSAPVPMLPPVQVAVREPMWEETFFAPPRTQSVYSISSEEEGAFERSISNTSGGSPVPSLKRVRFLSAASGLETVSPLIRVHSPTFEARVVMLQTVRQFEISSRVSGRFKPQKRPLLRFWE
eukprot:symbB.v1.2.026015.t1/scaffold2529.1/size77954/3